MTYMGGKQQLVRYIAPILNKYIQENNIENFYDVFCGGCNIVSNIECENLYANDLSPTLIALHEMAQKDYNLINTNSSREQWDRCYSEYKILKKSNFKKEPSIPLAEIGAIEWFGGFSGKGFVGGYGVSSKGRNQFIERYNNLKKQSETLTYKKINFSCGDYRDLEFKPNSLIYCDAPYKDSESFGINSKFNFAEYYKWLTKIAESYPIFISEQVLPNTVPASVIWEKEVRRTIKVSDRNIKKTDKLFFLDLRRSSN